MKLNLQRHAVIFGLVLMFAFTWLIDLLWAANTRSRTGIMVPQPLNAPDSFAV